MAIRPRVECRFHDVIPCEDQTQPVEFAVILTEKIRAAMSLRKYVNAPCPACKGGGYELYESSAPWVAKGGEPLDNPCPACNGTKTQTGWYVCLDTDDVIEPMHDKPFDTMTEAHHAGCQVTIEKLPSLVRELTKRLARREGVYE